MTVLDHPPYSPDLAPADYFVFPKVKSHLKGRLFNSFSDIQKAVTSTLNTTANDDFYKGIQKLYGRANLCVQLQEKCVENWTIKVSFLSRKYILPYFSIDNARVVYTKKV